VGEDLDVAIAQRAFEDAVALLDKASTYLEGNTIIVSICILSAFVQLNLPDRQNQPASSSAAAGDW